MTKLSLHAQAAAIDVAVRYAGRSGESDMLVRGLKAARQTLFKLQSWRDRLPTEAITVIVDHDANAAGERAARELEARWLDAGREVRLLRSDDYGDLNDIIAGDAA